MIGSKSVIYASMLRKIYFGGYTLKVIVLTVRVCGLSQDPDCIF